MSSIRRRRRGGAAVVVCCTIGISVLLWVAPAYAAASISPRDVDPDTAVSFTLSTSLDRAGFNVEVTTTAPAVFDVQACDGPPGWGCAVMPAADGTTIRWQREGSLNPTDGTFGFRALTPSQPAIYEFPTVQTYNDGQQSTSVPSVTVGEPFAAPSPTEEPAVEPSPEAPTPTPSPAVTEDPDDDEVAAEDDLQPLRPPSDDDGQDEPTSGRSPQVEALTSPAPAATDGRDRVGQLFVVAVVTLALATIGGALLAAANR